MRILWKIGQDILHILYIKNTYSFLPGCAAAGGWKHGGGWCMAGAGTTGLIIAWNKIFITILGNSLQWVEHSLFTVGQLFPSTTMFKQWSHGKSIT